MILILIAGIIPTLIVTCYMQMGMMNTLKEREMEYAGVFKTGSRCNRQSGADL